MADVKWIKIVTDVFSNKKIKQIDAMPDADTIIVIWFKLLCLAGSINENGLIILTKDIAYTDEMLATEFRKPLNTIRLALKTFESFGMIELVDNVYSISNWEKYQNVEKLDKIRDQTRIRVANYRSRQKLLSSNSTGNDNVTQCNATDKELDIDKDKEINNITSDVKTPDTPQPKKSGKIFTVNSVEMSLAQILLDCIKNNLPNYKTPNMQSWAREIDLMIRIDKRDTKEISEVIAWCQKDSFWMKNILSTATLRKQFDRLTLERSKRNGGSKQNINKPQIDFDD